MNKHIIPTVALVICLTIGVSVVSTPDANASDNVLSNNPIEFNEPVSNPEVSTTNYTTEFNFDNYAYWKKYGYSNIAEYNEALQEMREEAEGSADAAVSIYSSILSDEQKEKLYLYEGKMTKAVGIETYDKYSELFDEIIADCDSRMPKYTSTRSYSSGSSSSYSGGGGGKLTKSAGVNNYNGRRETWYSSRVLHHYRTSEWTPDANGVYRDKDGYVVVAASDLQQGSTVETSHGTGKVYDSGCAPGTTDIYVNW